MSFLRQSVQSLYQAVKRRFRQWTKPNNHTLILNIALDLTRSKSELVLENALLRQQLIVLERQTKRPKLTWRDRALFVLWASKLRTWRQALVIVQPDTVLRWHRDLFRRVRKHKSKRKQGRPPLTDDIVALIKRIVKENLTWGAERIRGELLKLGVRVSKSTIQKYMKDARESSRSLKQTQATFLRNHASEIWACDFLQTYDILFRIVFVFVIIEWIAEECVGQGRGQSQATITEVDASFLRVARSPRRPLSLTDRTAVRFPVIFPINGVDEACQMRVIWRQLSIPNLPKSDLNRSWAIE